jgi:hypothetical protein
MTAHCQKNVLQVICFLQLILNEYTTGPLDNLLPEISFFVYDGFSF